MNRKKKALVFLLCAVILAATLLGLVWHKGHYEMIDIKFYPKNAETLDLRGEEISISHYEKIRRHLPETKVLWDVPFQGNVYPQDTQKLTVSELKESDLKILGYFENLKTVDARGCREYKLLQQMQKTYPELSIQYQVTLAGRDYVQDAASIRADGMTEAELALLQYLPNLKEIRVEGAADVAVMEQVKKICQERGLEFLMVFGGIGWSQDTSALVLENTTQEELALLPLMPKLEAVHIRNPQMEASQLVQVAEELLPVRLTWEKELLGKLVSSEDTEVDLLSAISKEGAYAYEKAKSAKIQGDRDEIVWLFADNSAYPLPEMESSTEGLIEQVEQAMAYFPKAEKVLMTGALLDNEAMAAFREKHREDYKVVWTVQCGEMIARTDAPYFMPVKYHEYYFQDDDAVNLKYCEDMICVDVGHMSIKNCEWAAYMPNLQYLILAHTDVRTIEPLRNCKKLKFLEVDWSAVKDFSPLLDCKSLEDLNVGHTFGNFEVLEDMTWLKNLWLVDISRASAYRLNQALGETMTVMVTGAATVDNGWRELPNYYAMRDIMKMFYMEW